MCKWKRVSLFSIKRATPLTNEIISFYKDQKQISCLSVPQWGNYLIIPNNKTECDNTFLECDWSRINWLFHNLSLVQNETKKYIVTGQISHIITVIYFLSMASIFIMF